MDEVVIIKILEGKDVTSNELNTFITEYVKDQLDKDITGEQLSGILELIKVGIFDLRFAASKVAIKSGFNVLDIFDKSGMYKRTIVYK